MINQILYVDDDSTAQSLFNLVNKKAAFAKEVLFATSGQQVLDFYEQLLLKLPAISPLYPELLFIDLVMPIMDGWELLDTWVSKYLPAFPATQVIIISSSINPADRAKVAHYPCVLDFISKPATVPLLNEIRLKVQKS
ncbi:response regulator [Telluribacter sp. SYSU D00476]|uniref:response regulator n=1 Tax=Telluribacter sp. SYSU D00476 TaxID=2811430 RepID=UPI001FF4E4E4|nr:response regulator [Telluribacter sp. SYSU D00476]